MPQNNGTLHKQGVYIDYRKRAEQGNQAEPP